MDVKNQTIAIFLKSLPNGMQFKPQMSMSFIACFYSSSTCLLETIKNEYREMIDSVKAAWTLVGHRLKNHSITKCMVYYALRNTF